MIVAGSLFGSMALLADGWHMSTHVAAFAITLFAYRFARRHADNPRFSFRGTGFVVGDGTLLATCFHVLGIDQDLQYVHPSGRPISMIHQDGKPIKELL